MKIAAGDSARFEKRIAMPIKLTNLWTPITRRQPLLIAALDPLVMFGIASVPLDLAVTAQIRLAGKRQALPPLPIREHRITVTS
jgi:hypothetical protein